MGGKSTSNMFKFLNAVAKARWASPRARTYVFMIDTFHEHQLSVRPLGVGLILKRPTQLLDGDVSFQGLVESRAGERAHPGENRVRRRVRESQIDESSFTGVSHLNSSSCYISDR